MKHRAAFAAWVVVAGLSTRVTRADDVQVLADNVFGQLTASPPSASTVVEDLALLKADGSFSDVNYTDTTNASWLAFTHVNRLHDLAVAYAAPSSSYYGNATLKAGLTNAYNYWVSKDLTHPNWWFNQIGVPDSLSETMMVLQKANALPSGNFQAAAAIVDRALPSQGSLSATNLVWTAYATRNEGILRYLDPTASAMTKASAVTLVQNSFNKIGSTIKLTTSDGVNNDYSFHAHGPMLYNGGYGQAWLGDTARIAAQATGTSFGIPSANVRLVIDYVLNGDQFMTRGATYDMVTTGRDWSRTGQSTFALNIRDSIGQLLALDPTYRTVELTAFKNRLEYANTNGTADLANTAVGNRQYRTSDYMAQQRKAYLVSVKTTSTRTSLPEATNGENRKGGYGYDGLNLIYRTGNEYKEVMPVWDWYRLPGTTSERGVGGVGGAYNILVDGGRGATAVAGGASDGSVGTTAYKFSHFNVSANKSYFLFDKGEVGLGNSIRQTTANTAGGVVGTNVNQTLLKGSVVYSTAAGQSTTIGSGQTVTPAGLRWVNHNSIGYFFLTPVSNATIRTTTQSGSWYDINHGDYSSATITKNLFAIDLSHGTLPTGGTYLYAVIPGLAAGGMDAYLATNPFTLLRNDAVAHAVTDNSAGLTEANFYASGAITLQPGVTLTQINASQASSVLLQQADLTLTMSVDSPENWAGAIVFDLTGRYTGASAVYDATANQTRFTFAMPSGTAAGSTVTQTFTQVLPEPVAAVWFGIGAAGLLGRTGRTRRNSPLGPGRATDADASPAR